MTSPIKLILSGFLALVTACSESANQGKPPKENSHAVKSSESAGGFLFVASIKNVAGLAPNQRPADAPVIREFIHNDLWRTQLLVGISKPIPAGLDFLDSQGAWYTPFNQPGMPGYYDLRHWHDKAFDSNDASR